jgi:hypothetical protein
MPEEKERIHILQMIGDGKISAEEGARMLTEENGEHFGIPAPLEAADQPPRWIHVLVTDLDTGKARVNVRLPVNLVSTGIKMGAHLSPDMQELNIQQINDYVKRGITGKVMEVLDDDEGEKVAIFLE